MRPFKHFLHLAFLVTFLNGCTKAGTKPDGVNGANAGDAGGATFRVVDLDGEGRYLDGSAEAKADMNAKSASIWHIPRRADYTFTACVRDISTRQEPEGHQFAVEIPETRQRVQGVTPTNGKGCFSWNEPISFSYYVKRSRWIVLERYIVGTGVHGGRQLVKFGVNPWAIRSGESSRDGGPDFIDLMNKKVDPSLLSDAKKADAYLSGELLGQDQLFIDNVSIKTIREGEENKGTMFRLNISMEPKVLFEGQDGRASYKSIPDGDFAIIAHIVLSEVGDKFDKYAIVSSPGDHMQIRNGMDDVDKAIGASGSGRVRDGKLVAHVTTWIRDRFPQGNIRLVLKVIPKGIRGLKAAEGIYELGAFKNLSSSFEGQLTKQCRENGCDVSQYLTQATNIEELRKTGYASDNSPYLFDRMNLRFVQVNKGETTTQRTVTYSVATCVTDAFTGERPIGLPFKIVYKETGEVVQGPDGKDPKTGEDGCLRWSSTIRHKYYMPEDFVPRTVTVTKGNFSRDLKFYINPWDDKFTFGFDEREFSPEFWDEIKGRDKIPSRFFLSNFGYHTVRFQYNIDSLMALNVRKTVLMELDPRVLRYSGIVNARKLTEPLRDGIWLMKVAIQKNYLDPAQGGVHIDALKIAQDAFDFSNMNELPSIKKVKPVSEAGSEQTAPSPLLPPSEVHSIVTIDGEPRSGKKQSSVTDARTRLRRLGIYAPRREFISTQTALVRVTDGVIIQPVEFTMNDLRMMRVRSNFLIELQPVNELKLIDENKSRESFVRYLNSLEKSRKEKREALGKSVKDENNVDYDLEKLRKAELENENKQISERQKKTRNLFNRLSQQLRSAELSESGYEPFSLSFDQFDVFGTDDESKAEAALLKAEVERGRSANDFTKTVLPTCNQANSNCNDFVEMGENADDFKKGPGLARRTFVGPVIFLSNGYSDSVRATDNLDEARCSERVEFENDREKELDDYRKELFYESDDKQKEVRENTFYKYSEYFGSLRHLCNAQVDSLVEREAFYHKIYEENIPAVSSVYNFVKGYNMNFMSFSNEQPKAVSFDEATFKRCNFNLSNCMKPTTDHWVNLDTALDWINGNLSSADLWAIDPVREWMSSWIWGKEDYQLKKAKWTAKDLYDAVFNQKGEKSYRFALCTLMSANFATSVEQAYSELPPEKQRLVKMPLFYPRANLSSLRTPIFEQCIKNYSDPFMVDQKLRIFKTGEADDSYLFLGGYQMNINVGQSFSVGRSDSYSVGWGIEGTDFVGAAAGFAKGLGAFESAGALLGSAGLNMTSNSLAPISSAIKPLSLKVGGGTGMSNSDGTSISESTYLVAQIAKFRVRLDEYERCYVVNITDSFKKILQTQGITSPEVTRMSRPLFVCEGIKRNKPIYRDEMYFYFTQHFTEGDMLDQADLYNHPWLLGLRGLRDFGSFIALIRKQDTISIWDTVKNLVSAKPRSIDWPLAHMRDAYQKIVPSFPGFYTVLDESEGMTKFPLELTKADVDINGEVKSMDRRDKDSPKEQSRTHH